MSVDPREEIPIGPDPQEGIIWCFDHGFQRETPEGVCVACVAYYAGWTDDPELLLEELDGEAEETTEGPFDEWADL